MTSVMEAPTVASENKPTIPGLSAADIAILVGKSRSKGTYGLKLLEFAQSDEAAINPVEVWPIEFGQKEITTIYQGFNNAVKKAKMEDDIHIKQSDGSVFLLHKERVQLVLSQLADDQAEGVDDEADENEETVSE